MPKIPDCHRCQYFVNSTYMVCGVNPCDPTGSTCEDFNAIAQAAAETERHPLGGGYYSGDWIPEPFPPLATVEQLTLLDWHPQFTGRCPNCEMPMADTLARGWCCKHCEWAEGEEFVGD